MTPPARWVQQPQQSGIHQRNEALLFATARISLDIARHLRSLCATVIRTLTVPDNSLAGPVAKALAIQERQYSELELCFTWAQLLLAILGLSPDTLSADARAALQARGLSNAQPDSMKAHLLEYNIIRTHAGDSSNVRLATDGFLQPTLLQITRCLTAAGGQLRLGPAPRSTDERAVLAAWAPTASRRGV